jgi:LEA14-like dessication related protein
VKTRCLIVLALAALATGCTPRPQARLVAVDGARFVHSTTTVMVLVEIENPTADTLMLSGFDYEVEAKDWFTARGSYALSRYLAPGDVAYVSVPLPVKNFDMALGAPEAALRGVRFRLEGKLRALRPAGGETIWDVQQEGALAPLVETERRRRERYPVKPQIRVHGTVQVGT